MSEITRYVETPFGMMRMSLAATGVSFRCTSDDQTITVNGIPYNYRANLNFENNIYSTLNMEREPWQKNGTGSDAARGKVAKWCREYFETWKDSEDGRTCKWELGLESLRAERDKAEREHDNHAKIATHAAAEHTRLQAAIKAYQETKP